MINSYTALDLETTGLQPKQDRIIEIGAIKIIEGQEAGSFHSFLYPGRKLSDHITSLTGITDDMLKDAPEPETVIPRLLDFIGEDVLLGHRVLFDYSFVKRAAVNLGYSFEKNGIDTLKLSRKLLPELESRRLGSLCRYFGIPEGGHRALEDARAASCLYQKLTERFLDPLENAGDFQPAPLIYRTKKETPVTKSQKERLGRLLVQHGLTLQEDIRSLTRNEADRIIDRILAVHGRS